MNPIDFAHPHNIPITQILSYLEQQIVSKNVGVERLSIRAIYSVYQCLMTEFERYRTLTLLPLEPHASADTQSGRTSDIDIIEKDDNVFEAVEIKHDIQITPEIIKTAYEKFKHHRINRYYLLTTANMDSVDWDAINGEIDKISRQHGCQVIVNGVFTTLKYYLRLLKDTDNFISCYIANMKNDPAIKFDHKKAWNKIISGEN